MSDRRRRRLNDEGEDEATETGANPTRGERPSECESEGESGDVDLSETESATDDGTEKEDETEEGSETETEEGSYTEGASDSETETEEAEDYTDEEEGLDGERQSGDGQEQPEDDKPDDDEDKKNPAYVPRKGAFYEHDFRDGFEDTEDDKGEIVEEKKLKKLWQDEGKWGHDFYKDDLQAPKSREELIALYGYDIRAADKPPETPPVKRGRGRGRTNRGARIKDFLPRMAVIDTTEYGADTVPSLDENGLITYRDSKPIKASRGRGNNGHNNSFKYRGKDTMEGYSGGDRGDRYFDKPQRDNTSNFHGSQDARSHSDYPTLDESRGVRSNRNYNKDRGYSDRGREFNSQYGNQQMNQESNDQSNSHNHDRNSKRPAGSGRFSGNSYNDDDNSFYKKGDRNSDRSAGSNYQSRTDGRNNNSNSRSGDGGGSFHHQSINYNNRNDRSRENNYNNRQMDSNWRRSDPTGGDSSRAYQEQRGGGGRGYGGGRGGGGGRSKPYTGGDGDNYNLPKKLPDDHSAVTKRTIRTGNDNMAPRHQQHVVDAREFTNSKVTSVDDRVASSRTNNHKTSGDNVSSHQGPLVDGSVGNGGSTNNNVVISNKENVQTINVTITSTTTEKKSYAKERRAKGTTIPKTGELQQHGLSPVVMAGSTANLKSDGPNKQYPPPSLPVSGSTNLPVVSGGGTKRYSSQRQQQQAMPSTKGAYNPTEKPVSGNLSMEQGATLYNPALPPPSFFQHDASSGGTTAPTQPPPPPPPGGQDPQQRFNPSILPPGNPALSFGLPVPTPGLPIPAPTGSPNMFQGPSSTIGGPPPPPAAGPPLMGPPFIAPGMMYGTSPTPNPRVPPPATPVGFPIPLAAYTTGPPPPPTQPPASVVPPPVTQGTTSTVPGSQQLTNPPKKVYRGDITYYAPELQQPARTTQKRPKSAIPIVDPQEISQWKVMEKMQEQQDYDKPSNTNSSLHSHSSISQPSQLPPEGSTVVAHSTETRQKKEEQISLSSSTSSSMPTKSRVKPTTSSTDSGDGKASVMSEGIRRNAEVIKQETTQMDKSGGGSELNPNAINNNIVTPRHNQQKHLANSQSSSVSSANSADTVQIKTEYDNKVDTIKEDNVSISPLDLTSKQPALPAMVERSGDAGRFIKGKSTVDIAAPAHGSKDVTLSHSASDKDGYVDVQSSSNVSINTTKEEVSS